MIRTKDLEEYVRTINTGNAGVTDIEVEYRAGIIKRLRAYDRICHDLELMITKLCPDLSNRGDLT